MPRDYDKDAYPEPPRRTPMENKETALPNPNYLITNLFYYLVDAPVTAFRGALEGLQGQKSKYYHQRFRRVPLLTECAEGDNLCAYEAEMQWRRDLKVDQEIVKVMQARLGACKQREGHSFQQNCLKEIRQFQDVSRAYQSRYMDLGAYGSSRSCLMKQKERMMEEALKAQSAA